MAVNITTDTNTVKVTSTSTNNVKIVDNKNNTTVSVSQPTTRIIKVATIGPQGPAGAGSSLTGGTDGYIPLWSGSSALTSSIARQVSGTLEISGSVNITRSLTQGDNVSATGPYSHAQGLYTSASNTGSHAEGIGFIVNTSQKVSLFKASYITLYGNQGGINSVAIVSSSISSSTVSGNVTGNIYGSFPYTTNNASISSGSSTVNPINYDFYSPIIIQSQSYNAATNRTTFFYNTGSLQSVYYEVTGKGNIASGIASHTEGFSTRATGLYSHAEGYITSASQTAAHAEGQNTIASGQISHAEGTTTIASGVSSHAEGGTTQAQGNYSHAEGYSTIASGVASHAEGQSTLASGVLSHAEGYGTTASGTSAHAEGTSTNASGKSSHAEGTSTNASGVSSHAEGKFTTAPGNYSHAEGIGTEASGLYQHVQGKYNIPIPIPGAFIHGNGTPSIESNLIYAAGTTIEFSGSLHVKPNTTASVDLLSVNQELVLADTVTTTGEDTSFYTNITSWGDGKGFNGAIKTIVSQSDGKILIGGEFTSIGGSRNRLARSNADGTEDTAFNTNLGTGFNGAVRSIAVQPADGKILVAGEFNILNEISRNYLVRLNYDGTVDTTFYNNYATFDGVNDSIFKIIIDSNGKILIGGCFTNSNGNSRYRLIRLNANGTEDTAFYTNLGSGFNASVQTLALQSDSKIVVGGSFNGLNGNDRYRLVRLNDDGTEDTTFYNNYDNGYYGVNSDVYALKVQSDGKILVGGAFDSYNSIGHPFILRLNNNGTEDTTFYNNLGGGFSDYVYSLEQQIDGKILVGGQFTSFNSNSRGSIVRLNNDGTEDSEFYDLFSTGFDAPVYIINPQSNGKILIGGSFLNLNNNSRTYIAQLAGIAVHTDPLKENVSINRTPDNNLINIQGRNDAYNIIDVTNSNGAKIFKLDNSGSLSHGINVTASGSYSHAEGNSTIASGAYSHAEGASTIASGSYSHAQGRETIASGYASHAEGVNTIATGNYSHTEGFYTVASGYASHAEGNSTIASGSYQHVQGQYNISSSAQSAFIIGNGTADNARSNLVFASGSQVQITGSLLVTGSLTMSPSSSFILPCRAAASPQTGSAYWSGSLLFVYNGTRYMSASFF